MRHICVVTATVATVRGTNESSFVGRGLPRLDG